MLYCFYYGIWIRLDDLYPKSQEIILILFYFGCCSSSRGIKEGNREVKAGLSPPNPKEDGKPKCSTTATTATAARTPSQPSRHHALYGSQGAAADSELNEQRRRRSTKKTMMIS